MNSVTLIENFIILAYADMFNRRQYDIVGTTDNTKKLEIYSYDYDKKTYEKKYSDMFDNRIYAVLPGSFEGNKKTSLIVVLENESSTGDDKYINKLVTFENNNNMLSGKITDLIQTKTPPFIILDQENMRPTLFLDTDDGYKIMEIVNLEDIKYKKVEFYDVPDNLNYKVCEDHTSTYVDFNGTLKAQLAMIVEINKEKYVMVFKVENNKFYYLGRYKLADINTKTGPILFGDFTNKGMNSMLYVSVEGTSDYYLNIMENTWERKESMYYKKHEKASDLDYKPTNHFNWRKIPISNIASGSTPVINLDDIGNNLNMNMPGGMFVSDIDFDGFIEVFLLMKDSNDSTYILPLKYKDNKYEVYTEIQDISDFKNVISISAADYNDIGRETLILNRITNGAPVIEAYENSLVKLNMKLGLTTLSGSGDNLLYGMSLPGCSYLLMFEADKLLLATATNFAPGPFLHLNTQTANIGLGDQTFILYTLIVGLPIYDKADYLYVVNQDLIQNFDLLVFANSPSKYRIVAFFKTSEHQLTIIKCLLLFVSVNAVALIYFYVQEIRRKRDARSKDTMHPVFRAL